MARLRTSDEIASAVLCYAAQAPVSSPARGPLSTTLAFTWDAASVVHQLLSHSTLPISAKTLTTLPVSRAVPTSNVHREHVTPRLSRNCHVRHRPVNTRPQGRL